MTYTTPTARPEQPGQRPQPPQPTAPAPAPAPATVRDGRGIRALSVLAIVACLPYLMLKVAWVAGSEIGIPAGSTLLDPDNETVLRAGNALTILMDAAVIGLVLLLTRPWGRRVPAWLLVLPMWLATGLLAPIMVAFPVQLVAGSGATATEDTRAFLDSWVFGVVYGGFIVQGLALGALFVPYARDRWGWMWRGRVGRLPESPLDWARKGTALIAAALALVPLTVLLVWASGSARGLSESMAADRNADSYITHGSMAFFCAVALAGVLLLAFRPVARLPLAVPLALAWTGSGVLTGWGGWMTMASLAGYEGRERVTPVMSLTYSVEMIVGLLILTAGVHFLAERVASGGARLPE